MQAARPDSKKHRAFEHDSVRKRRLRQSVEKPLDRKLGEQGVEILPSLTAKVQEPRHRRLPRRGLAARFCSVPIRRLTVPERAQKPQVVGHRLPGIAADAPGAEGRAPCGSRDPHRADLGRPAAASGAGVSREGAGCGVRRAAGPWRSQPRHAGQADHREGGREAVAETLRQHARQLLRRSPAAGRRREGDQRVDRKLGANASPPLPLGAAGRLGGGHRKSGTKSGTINARQGPSGAINPSRRPRKIATRREGRGNSVPPAGIEQTQHSRRKTGKRTQSDVKSDVGVENRPKSPVAVDTDALADLAARLASLPPEVLAALQALFGGEPRQP